jgi:glutamate/tyrosine decarboxylase-like PLP-dependent enzyme
VSALDPKVPQVKEWLEQVSDFVLSQLASLPTDPAMGQMGEAARRVADEVSKPIAEAPLAGGWSEILETVDRAAKASLGTHTTGYLAYVPGGGLVSSALAELIAGVINRYTGIAEASPALTRLEWDVIRWFAAEFGYGEGARGILTSGGSMANLSAIITARHQAFGDSGDFREATVYVSSQVHHCVSKSIRLAGIPGANIREIAVDSELRLDVAALGQALDEDANRRPFLVVASAGTTNTGVIDPLGEIARLCRERGLWFHVDGAYGATFNLCEAGRRALSGIEQADSITFDPHKGMFLPYGTGGLVVRDGQALAAAHRSGASYLQDLAELEGAEEQPSPADYSLELSRPFRGLHVWIPLMLHGAGAFREALAERMQLAAWAYEQLEGLELELLGRPELSVFAFRLPRRAGEGLEAWNVRNWALQDGINRRRRVHLSSTQLPVEDGLAFTLRICVVSFRTTRADMGNFVEDLVESMREIQG